MSKVRDELVKVYHFLYSSAPAERSEMGWPLCVYCGDPADCVDHVPPVSKVVQYRDLGVHREMYLLVKACKPCNEMLGSTVQTDVLARIDEAKTLIRKKLGRRDVNYTWAEEDLEDLGRNLKSHVGSAMRKTESLIRRIEYRGGYRALLGMLKDTE